jgi:hypothetical protein
MANTHPREEFWPVAAGSGWLVVSVFDSLVGAVSGGLAKGSGFSTLSDISACSPGSACAWAAARDSPAPWGIAGLAKANNIARMRAKLQVLQPFRFHTRIRAICHLNNDIS